MLSLPQQPTHTDIQVNLWGQGRYAVQSVWAGHMLGRLGPGVPRQPGILGVGGRGRGGAAHVGPIGARRTAPPRPYVRTGP
ncbi:MAG: hypothetical protein IT327_01445 [Anaerolineae bacterium]|nr:hypothetical protein [Anaerolineae bacterium]